MTALSPCYLMDSRVYHGSFCYRYTSGHFLGHTRPYELVQIGGLMLFNMTFCFCIMNTTFIPRFYSLPQMSWLLCTRAQAAFNKFRSLTSPVGTMTFQMSSLRKYRFLGQS